MSLLLNQGSEPNDIEVKTMWPIIKEVRIGEYYLSMEDFEELVLYVLTNSDLTKNDPRYKLVEKINNMKVGPGWNSYHNEDSKRYRM
jgi:hypothetical protein